MLDEIVFAEAGVRAIRHTASPPLEMSVAFILVADPVGFSLERFRFSAFGKGACEGVDIFVDVFGPVGGFCKFFDFEADGAFEFCW